MALAIYRLIALPACVPQSKAPGPIAKGPVTALCVNRLGHRRRLSFSDPFPLFRRSRPPSDDEDGGAVDPVVAQVAQRLVGLLHRVGDGRDAQADPGGL